MPPSFPRRRRKATPAEPSRPRHVFVVGYDAFNADHLNDRVEAGEIVLHSLLDYSEVKERDRFSLNALIDLAESRLDQVSVPVDAIIGWWDFPTTTLVPVLCQRRGIPGPSLAAVLKCEDKFWSRSEQRKVVPEHIPAFMRFNPFTPDVASTIGLHFPYWVKPIKGFASQLSYRIANEGDLDAALPEIRTHIGRLADPFAEALALVDTPQKIDGDEEGLCIAEEAMTGRQCTVEGFVHQGQVTSYAIIDSIRYPHRSSFQRYQYPSALPLAVRRRMTRAVGTLLRHIGYDQATFNAEFFYDESQDKVWLLEVNPRLSQSHADLFTKVDGATHLGIMVDLALGQKPRWPPRTGRRMGKARVAAKCFLRAFDDGIVQRVPDPASIDRLTRQIPGLHVQTHVAPGQRLADLHDQDSYSYILATLHIGAASQQQLLKRYRACEEGLRFDIAPVAAAA